ILHLFRDEKQYLTFGRVRIVRRTGLRRQAQRQVAPAKRQVGVVRRRPDPHPWTRRTVVHQFSTQTQYQCTLQRRQHQSFACKFHATPSTTTPATSRRRNCSQYHPPTKNSAPNTTRLADRPRLSITFEKKKHAMV